jgi:NO-binding membrane sensor protein with MHYT domain
VPRDIPVSRIALGVGALLLVPLAAMQFSDEVAWGPLDFLFAGVILFSAGVAILWLIRRIQRPRRRVAAVAAVILLVAIVWAELAVGLFH